MNHWRIYLSILGSVLAHALLAALILIRPHRELLQEIPIEVDWVEAQKGLEATSSTAKSEAQPSLKSQGAENLSSNDHSVDVESDALENVATSPSGTLDLGLSTASKMKERWLKGEAGTQGSTLGPSHQVGASGHGWSAAVQYGNSMDLAFTNSNLGFFQALYQRIDSQLVYPDDISRQRIQGKIRVELEVGQDGRLLRLRSAETDNDLLQAFVLAYLIQILREPLPEKFWLNDERSVIAVDFDFRIRIEGNPRKTLTVGVQKNHFFIARENSVDPWLNEKVEEIFTHYVPPVIPIPGGVYVDLILAYKYVKNIMENAPVESEARQARLDRLHEFLKQTIRLEKTKLESRPTPEPEA